MEISVVIPAYNEEKVIIDTVRQVKDFLHNNFNSWEIIIVDDKSKDGTLEIINNLSDVRVLRSLRNHGKGYTVRKGVRAAQGDLILFMDADSSTPIEELTKLLKYINDYSLVIGSRAMPDSEVKIRQNFLKVFLGRAGNVLIKMILGLKINDTQCGFKLLKKEAKHLFDKLTIEDWGFDFELIFLARKNNLTVKEVPVVWINNFDSKVKLVNYFISLGQLFKIRFNNLFGKYN